jgi:hypothetical protein
MTPWSPNHAINESDLKLAAKAGAIKKFFVTQCSEGFYITVHLHGKTDDIHLATRRQKDKPRMFKLISLLIEYIRKNFPSVTYIQLFLLPGQTEDQNI